VRYTLKTPYRDGTTHVIFEPEDFIARLAALVRGSGHRSAPGDVLGPMPQARIRHRHRDLPAMRRPAARHCQHRGVQPAINTPIATRPYRFDRIR